MRNRQCDNPNPVNGSADCVGVKSVTQGCNMQGCLGGYNNHTQSFRGGYIFFRGSFERGSHGRGTNNVTTHILTVSKTKLILIIKNHKKFI